MAGLALVFDTQNPITVNRKVFDDLLTLTARRKHLPAAPRLVEESHCAAAKFDTAATLHRGVTVAEAGKSWLLAAGTVIDPAVTPEAGLGPLLADYLAHGDAVLSRLDGHFALAIYNHRHNSLLVATDPSGFVSVFYGQQGSRHYISTSALALAKILHAKPDELGTRYFIAYGELQGERTLWQDVKRLPPAAALKFTPTGANQFTYWALSLDETITRLSLPDTVDFVISRLSEFMRRNVSIAGPAWLSLTGGMDSRALAALAHYSGIAFKSYCHGQPDARDVRLSAAISRQMDWEHQYFPLPDDWGIQRAGWLERALGHGDAHLGVLKNSRILREQTLKAEQFAVSLWGFGGETYRGYHWKQEFTGLNRGSTVDYDRFIRYRAVPLNVPIFNDGPRWQALIRENLKSQLIAVGERRPDWPKTVKLDLLGEYFEHGWSGAHLSTALGVQRVICPFDFKQGVSDLLSINYKWRTHGRLFRLILERLNPRLADMETADGGPALPMRLTNLHRFVPYWLGLGEKFFWLMGRRYLGRNLWRKKDAGPAGAAYPTARWRAETLANLEDSTLLVPAHMRSAPLYRADALQTFLGQVSNDDFEQESLLSNVITVEMALRAVDASF